MLGTHVRMVQIFYHKCSILESFVSHYRLFISRSRAYYTVLMFVVSYCNRAS